jgi:adenosine deaminase
LVLSEMKKWVEDKGTRLIPRLIISIDRSRGVEEARENMDIAKELFKMGHDYVVGVDLGGNPTKGTFKEFKGLLEEVRTAGMKVTVHAGEVDNLEEVNDIVAFRPDRLGHFLCVDDGVWEKMEREGGDIPIEVCPTSNVMTLGLEGLGQHPILERLVKEGYPVSINTDDAGVFNTKQSLELYRVAEMLGLNEYTVSGLVWGAVDLVFEGNRRTRARVARDVMKGIKGILDKLERQEQGGT